MRKESQVFSDPVSDPLRFFVVFRRVDYPFVPSCFHLGVRFDSISRLVPLIKNLCLDINFKSLRCSSSYLWFCTVYTYNIVLFNHLYSSLYFNAPREKQSRIRSFMSKLELYLANGYFWIIWFNKLTKCNYWKYGDINIDTFHFKFFFQSLKKILFSWLG